MTRAEDFVGWAWETEAGDIPAVVTDRAALHVLDGLGTALAAARLDAVPYAAEVARSIGGGAAASLIGEAPGLTAAAAALANGTLVHGLDFDDTHTSGLVHATAVTLPAALAVAQAVGASGREFARAMVLGYELVGRLGAAAPEGFHARGFHATSVCGTFSSALVAALLYGLTPEEAVNALGIAGSMSSGTLEFLATGASTKQLHPGWASMAGIVAARLGRSGATGPATIFEGRHGLYALFSDLEPSTDAITRGLGEEWQVDGIRMKPYPACHLMHRALSAAGSLKRVMTADEIDEVRLDLPAASMPIVAVPEDSKRNPRTAYEAKFSVQWSLAAMLTSGRIDIESYLPGELGRADLRELAGRVHVESASVSGPAAEAPVRVLVRLRDGSELVGDSTPDDPSAADLAGVVRSKFAANCASPVSAEIIEAVASIAAAPDAGHLMELLVTAKDSWTPTPDAVLG